MDNEKISSESEDISSDFFDDFDKEEFVEGLSVVDVWNESEKTSHTPRTDMENLDHVQDLRHIILSKDKEEQNPKKGFEHFSRKRSSEEDGLSPSFHVDIKTGIRRDLNKTNKAMKKYKELKVKEHLAKYLESKYDRPPGTELDDFGSGSVNMMHNIEEHYSSLSFSEDMHERRHNVPVKSKESPRYRESPVKRREVANRQRNFPPRQRVSPFRQKSSAASRRRESPPKTRRMPTSPRKSYYSSPRRNRSPQYRSSRRQCSSSRKSSPVFKRYQSRSPYKSHSRSSQSPLYTPSQNNCIHPNTYSHYIDENYAYPQPHIYPDYVPPYNYSNQPALSTVMPAPQPVPPPVISLDFYPESPAYKPCQKAQSSILNIPMAKLSEPPEPTDALPKLVAEGKLSQEDYLKLTPNKGSNKMDTHTRVSALNRCNNALSKLSVLIPPNRLLIKNDLTSPNPKSVLPKYCSPLKRQSVVEFNFTKHNNSSATIQNKQIVQSLLTALGLDKVVNPSNKLGPKNTKDAAVQTIKPFCEVCDIRESIKCEEIGTSIDPEYISAAVHTQVEEKDLISSKAVFNPSGSVADGAPISIAHMTPAQLVSQLAARAKTLKQLEPQSSNQYHTNQGPYNYDDRRDHGYHNNYNHHY